MYISFFEFSFSNICSITYKALRLVGEIDFIF